MHKWNAFRNSDSANFRKPQNTKQHERLTRVFGGNLSVVVGCKLIFLIKFMLLHCAVKIDKLTNQCLVFIIFLMEPYIDKYTP